MSEWISVDERLPEDLQQIIMIAVGVGPNEAYTTDQYCGWMSVFNNKNYWIRWPHPMYEPTHWMKQSEPPK